MARLFLVVGILVSPRCAVAATVPMLIAYDAAVRPTATTPLESENAVRPEAERVGIIAYDDALDEYGDDTNLHVVNGARAVHAYDWALNLAERHELVEGVIYDAAARTVAAEAAPEMVTLYHGTTASSAARIAAKGFRAGEDGVFFAEDFSTAAHFAQEAMAERGAVGGTVLKFTMPADVAAGMSRGTLGAARGAPAIDILGGSGYEMVLEAGRVGAFNAGVQEGTIGVTRLIVGGPP